MSEATRTVEIVNKRGLHARASAKFVKLAATFDAEVRVSREGQTVDARSIMGLMMLAAAPGCCIDIAAEGHQAEAAIEALRSGKADAYAENAHMLSLYAERLPGSRVLGGRYTVIQHAVATPKGKAAASEYLKTFVEEAKADGTVSEAIRAAGLRRTRVAPPSQEK